MSTPSLKVLSSIKKLPDAPGVYFFLGSPTRLRATHRQKGDKSGIGPRSKILYIGKATSLRSRVSSYFNGRVLESRGPLIVQLTKRVKKITFQKTDSVLEAVILETYFIKKHQPPYNSREKDDKSFNHVVVTKEAFPRVLVVRGKDLAEQFPTKKIKYHFGPFLEGTALREALRLVRKIFPFRDYCALGRGKPCFNAQIGLCPGVCTDAISKEEYAKTIRNIKLFFEGKKKTIVSGLKRDMKAYAKAQEFEKAAEKRRQLFALLHIQDIALVKRDLKLPHRGVPAYRIESYDVAHIGGSHTVGVFTVIEDGRPKKSDYRMFQIRRAARGSDTDALKEVLGRRLRHPEWPMPQLIAIDGGISQKNAAAKVLRDTGVNIPVVSVVKDEHHRPREILGEGKEKHDHERAILLGNSEAHRFAVTYHRLLRKKSRLRDEGGGLGTEVSRGGKQ